MMQILDYITLAARDGLRPWLGIVKRQILVNLELNHDFYNKGDFPNFNI